MHEKRHYKCFISSPSDTPDERDACEEIINEINSCYGKPHRIILECVRWEKDASPSSGTEPQAVIKEQLFNDIDIYIGIFAGKFGTPTKKYNSGTEEEFNWAINKKNEGQSDIEIKMYFNNLSTKPSDNNEHIKINDFKKLIRKKHDVLNSAYDNLDDFKKNLRRDLTKFIINKNGTKSNDLSEQNSVSISKILEQRLQEALQNFEGQKIEWVQRTFYKTGDLLNEESTEAPNLNEIDLINCKDSTLIYAQPQFGLTCLSHFLILQARNKGLSWIYLDANNTSSANCSRLIKNEVVKLGIKEETNIDCIVLDSWNKNTEGMSKLLHILCQQLPNSKLLIMSSETERFTKEVNNKTNRQFTNYTLRPLTQNNIRSLIEISNTELKEDNDKILKKMVCDLQALNIHRTPLNCLMLLKTFEYQFNNSLVNRTKLIQMILTLLFDFSKTPSFSTKPDVEHCNHFLGYFCEKIIKKHDTLFSQEKFINEIQQYTKKNKIDINVHDIFTILCRNRIIVSDMSGRFYKFRHMYWVYYFVAHWMDINSNFYRLMTENKRYVSYIDILDFYTGIKRNNNDLLDLITTDLQNTCDKFENDTGLVGNNNIFNGITWKQSEEDLNDAHSKIKNEILNSKLPDSVKDEYADKIYDFNKPNIQELPQIYQDYSLGFFHQIIIATSSALRNSEFIQPDKKDLLLNQITRSWQLMSKLFFVLAPLLARQNTDHILIDDWNIRLSSGYMKKEPKEKFKMILCSIPNNVINWYGESLYTERLSLVFKEKINSENNPIIKHLMMRFIINNKPQQWDSLIENYIKSVMKDSYYLLDIHNSLLATRQYDLLDDNQSSRANNLVELIYAKKKMKDDRGTKKLHLRDIAKSDQAERKHNLIKNITSKKSEYN